MPNIPKNVLDQDLTREALAYTQRRLHSLPPLAQQQAATALDMGGRLEVRVRMAAGAAPLLSLFVIGDKGEVELPER